MAGKKVLLARPHTFIVAEMQPFLTRAGYAPHKLAALDDLMGLNPASFSGVVISTAVVSAIGATVEEVFVAVRRKMPRVPVIFAGLRRPREPGHPSGRRPDSADPFPMKAARVLRLLADAPRRTDDARPESRQGWLRRPARRGEPDRERRCPGAVS
jgi:hypothetical protein